MPRLSVTLTEDELDLIRTIAANERRSVSNWLRIAMLRVVAESRKVPEFAVETKKMAQTPLHNASIVEDEAGMPAFLRDRPAKQL